jgi:hypothetical protein
MDYSLGICGSTEVEMANGEWKRMDSVALGDDLKHSGKVLGVVRELCAKTVVSPAGIVFSRAQLVYDAAEHKWKRSANRWTDNDGDTTTLYSVFTVNCSVISIRKGESVEYIRDYREAPLPEMEDEYEKEFLVAH